MAFSAIEIIESVRNSTAFICMEFMEISAS